MPFTRRSLLKALGVLPAAGIAGTQLAGCKFCPPFHPSPKSVYVLLEGPWLIYPTSDTTLKAVSIGRSMDGGCFYHFCAVQTWHCGDLVSQTLMDEAINTKQYWQVDVRGSDTTSLLTDVIGKAFEQQPFIWAKSDTSGVCKGHERVVIVPKPTRIYIGGLLKNATPEVPGQSGDIKAHVVTIMEYAPQNDEKVSLTLTTPNQTSFLPAPAHLVFRMYHYGPMGDPADVDQANRSFGFLQDRLPKTGSSIKLNLKTNTDYNTGKTDGIKDEELGLHHPDSVQVQAADQLIGNAKAICKDGTYSNCCGPVMFGGGGT